MIAQGEKRAVLGEDAFAYAARHFVITAVDLPVMAQILKAGMEKPYLAMTLKLDLRLIAQLMSECKLSPPRLDPGNRGMIISKVSPTLLNAFHRLVDLLEEPGDIPILAPLILREIHYRLLTGDQGSRLRQMAAAGSRSNQVSQVIDWLKGNLEKRIRIEDLAAQAGMSSSALYQHFQAITAISPLQFQKRLRLTEARKLMLTEHLDAATVAYKVGYESPSQFSREYRRQFGSPPLQDIKEVQQTMSNGPRRIR